MEIQASAPKFWQNLGIVLLSLLPALYVLVQWQQIPETIPVHFNASLEPDRYGHKTELIVLLAVMTGVTLLAYFATAYIHRIDPKRAKNKTPNATFIKMGVGMVVLLTLLTMTIVLKSINPENKIIDKLELPLLGLLFVFIGNYMHNLKPNYYAGIKVPWTLASEYNWRKTHQLAAPLWFGGGLITVIVSFFVPPATGFTVLMICVLIMTVIPIGYSYNLFRRESKNPGYFDKQE